jgi:Rod binding domain-containing protein
VSALTALAPQEIVAQGLPAAGSGTAHNADAAQQFEGMLMSFVFQKMRQTVQPSGLFGNGGNAQSTYEYLLDQAVASNAMKAGKGWGLSQRLEAKWNAPITNK